MSNQGMAVQNAPEREEYIRVLEKLKPVLRNLPPKIIAIDENAGVGKTTLGRFLAWRFNVSLLETDLFIDGDQIPLEYRTDDLKNIINARTKRGRPIIVEWSCPMRNSTI